MNAQPGPQSAADYSLLFVTAFAALYAALLFAGSAWRLDAFDSLLRPAYGLCVAALLVDRRRWLVLVIIAAAAATGYAVLRNIGTAQALLMAVGDPLTALVAATLARRLAGGSIDFTRPRSVAALCVALAAAPVPAALLSSTAAGAAVNWSAASLASILIGSLALAWRTRPPAARALRIATAATLIAGSLATWYLAASVRSQALQALDVAAAVALPVVAAITLLLGSVLLSLYAQRQAAQRIVRLIAWATNQLDSERTELIGQRLEDVLKEAGRHLGASNLGLYLRDADSSLFRQVQQYGGGPPPLPDAILAKQLKAVPAADSGVFTLVQDASCTAVAAAGETMAVHRTMAGGGAAVLVAAMPGADPTARDTTVTLLKLLLPACCAALSESRALRAEREAQTRFRAVMSGVPEPVCLALADGTIVDINAAFEALTGFSRDVVCTSRMQDLALLDDDAFQSAVLASGTDEPRLRSMVLRHKSGAAVPCDVHVLRVETATGPLLMMAARDSAVEGATQQQFTLEKQISQAQRMEAIGQLTQGVAHDFNNILGSIMGYTSLARMQGQTRKDSKLSSYLGEIETAGKRATLLIQQMLTFSRRGRSNPAPLPANEVLSRVASLLPSLLPTSIDLRVEVSQNLPRLVVDAAQFEQAVISLAVNARDAIRDRGTITLGTRRFNAGVVSCSSCRKPVAADGVGIFVADTGTGIAPEVMDRLFEPFFTTKEVGRGTGLGLSGVHGFVHNHDGHILVSSEQGVGSEFCLVLPTQPARIEPVAATPEQPPPPTLRRRHILLADDQQSLASLMKQVLESRDFVVTAETDGIDAHSRFSEQPDAFDAVVTDQFMPGIDGLELARRVRAVRPEIPVVLCTGLSPGLSDADVAAAGISRVFRKPLRVMEFARELEELLADSGTRSKRNDDLSAFSE